MGIYFKKKSQNTEGSIFSEIFLILQPIFNETAFSRNDTYQ
jgi:hypothetical protein